LLATLGRDFAAKKAPILTARDVYPPMRAPLIRDMTPLPLALFGLLVSACAAPAGGPARFPAPVPTSSRPTETGKTPAADRPSFTALNDTCALAADGRLFCFGIFRSHVEITPDEVNYASAIPGIDDASSFSGRSNLCYAHRSSPKRITCLSRGFTGAALQTRTEYELPDPVRELSGPCAITTSSSIYCWGTAASHHFLTGKPWSVGGVHVLTPVPPTKLPLPPVRGFVKALGDLCIATEDGRIGCFGDYNVLAEREALRKKQPTWQGVDKIDWLAAPKGTVSAFVAGIHTKETDRHKNALCYQSEQGVFSCENPRETTALVTWLNATAIRQVVSFGDAVIGLSSDGKLRAFRLGATSWAEIANVLGDRAIPDVVAFGVHHQHACVLDRKGDVSCFGVRDHGALGTGEPLSSPRPVRVDVPRAVELTSEGGSQFCTRQESGRVHCWGGFDAPGIVVGRQIAEVSFPEPATKLAGGETLCARGRSGWWCTSSMIRAARRDGFSPLKDPSGRSVPLDAELAASSGYGLFVSMPSGERSVFWYSSLPQPLVIERFGTKGDRALPGTESCVRTARGTTACAELSGFVYWVDVPAGIEPKKLMASRHEVVLLTMKGELYVGSRAEREPVKWEATPRLTGIRDAIEIDNPDQSGASSICVLREAGDVQCRGHNRYGELGDGTYAPRADFRRVDGLPAIESFAAGAQGACALDTSGQVHCWGGDRSGALGQGSKRTVDTPVPISIR
jgi:hypothetical protein